MENHIPIIYTIIMKDLSIQSLILGISILSVFIWGKSELTVYTVPLLGICTSFYLVIAMKRKSQNIGNRLLTTFLLTTSSLLLIQATGGLHSILFFLIYFMAFYISFSLRSETVFLFTIAIFFFFLPDVMTGDILTNSTKIISFLLLSPLAYFFGKEVVLHEKEVAEIKELKTEAKETAERIIKDVSEVVKNEGKTLKEEDLARLHDIVEESRQLEKEAGQ